MDKSKAPDRKQSKAMSTKNDLERFSGLN
jgi:uncharacterized membrane protein YdjX (TVP38/TMEM64 family)